jgi:7,8-dihydropterin-6-yl-methyl-4-(beta-D-ribofuranosyl)aminobenzene 5'-phosphate synthase
VAGVVRVTILVENDAVKPGLRGEHGFAAWIETADGCVLFDTGQGDALGPNAEALGVDLSRADAIVLSHGHYDHTGGLPLALDAARNVPVYVHPAALDPKYAGGPGLPTRDIGLPPAAGRALAKHAGRIVHTLEPTHVLNSLFATGRVPRETAYEDTGGPFYLDEACTVADEMLDDQAVYFAAAEGLVLIVGCAHAGVVNTMRHVAKHTGADAFACVMGGTHLVGASEERIRKTLDAFRQFDVTRIGPAHCTGNQAVARFEEAFPDRFFGCHAGTHFEFTLSED